MADIRSALMPYAVRGAEDGYAEDARELLRLIASYIAEGKELPLEAKEYLVAGLKAIAGGDSPDAALKLNGRKKHSTTLKNIAWAQAVHGAVHKGKTLEEAYNIAIEETGHHGSPEAIRAAYYEYKSALEGDFQ